MMNRAEESFWKLLRAGLWDSPLAEGDLPPLGDEEWHQVMRIANSCGVTGIVADGLELLPAGFRAPMSLVNKVISWRMSLMKMHCKHNACLHDVIGILAEEGVTPVLLKGQGVAGCFIRPESRTCGDIDIYVGEKKIDDLIVRLKNRGITCDEEIDDNEKHAVFMYNDIGIELHRHTAVIHSMAADRKYQRWWDEGVASGAFETFYVTADGRRSLTAVEGGRQILVAPPQQNSVFLFYHLFHHFTSNQVQFRQFCDLARYLHTHRESIDRDALGQKLDELKLRYPWQAFGSFMEKYIGLAPEDIPLYDPTLTAVADKIADRLRKKRMFPKSPRWKRPSGRLGGKIYSYIHYFMETVEVHKIFPDESVPYLVCSTVRGIKNLFNRANRTGTREHYMERRAAAKD